ncbi:MAG TPA: DUF3592 domain-containing protein [Terracidiphilus sp.]|jgi:hypothetical protein|nr:DUF3592 domain-containing protein [Terracidiphilus sp.]
MAHGWFERLRGVDKWPFVPATVISVRQIVRGNRRGVGAWRKISFSYCCGSQDFDGRFFVDSYSSIYEVAAGDTFDIQYNPRIPSQHFCEEAKSLFFTTRVIILLTVVLVILFVLANAILPR